MKNIIRLSLALLALPLLASAASAQSVAFIATTGSDANPCTRTAPCRSMQRGVNAAPDGGELQVLDSGGYGPNVVITKSITVSAVGVEATVAAPSGIAVTVNAPDKSVTLRGLRLNGLWTAERGLRVDAVGALYVERCRVERFTLSGMLFSSAGEYTVKDTVSRNNGSDALRVRPESGTARVVVDHSHFLDSFNGLNADKDAKVVITNSTAANNDHNGFIGGDGASFNISDSTAANNGDYGFFVSDGGSQMNVSRCVSRGNGLSGYEVAFAAVIRVGNSTATNNGTGFANSTGGTFESLGNNTVQGNATNTSGTITPIGGV